MKKASILLAHGSSDANWLAPFATLKQHIASQLPSDTPLEMAYMELAEPSLLATVEKLVRQGHAHIDVLPLFFAAGRHLRKDVPNMLEQQQQQLTQQGFSYHIELHPPIGQEPEVAGAIADIVVRQLS